MAHYPIDPHAAYPSIDGPHGKYGYSAGEQVQPAQFYHGTNARLLPGDHLNPGHASNFGVGEDASFVHVTTSQETAHGYADWAARRAENAKIGIYPRGFSPLDSDHDFGHPERHVYQVEPTGSVERDNSTLEDQFRSRHPVRVVREV